MHCASCKTLIEDVANELPGVKSCTVNFATGEGEIEHDENFDFNNFKREVSALGSYTVEAIS